jgi:DNA polymerase IV (DinB-like DNA polymerase)
LPAFLSPLKREIGQRASQRKKKSPAMKEMTASFGEFKDKRQRIIFHVDMDSFYASCELAKNPELADQPFIVGADPKEGEGRGVVLSCNYPARKFGIRSGMPISRAWQLCREAHYILPDHNLYGQVSKRVMKILGQFSPRMEQVSIDEAYLDFTDDPVVAILSGAERTHAIHFLAQAIKTKVKEKERITCSIGVSNSKIVAKIVTDMNKPDGLTIVETDKVVEFLDPLPVEKIPGVGKKTRELLFSAFNVKTISDLRNTPLELLEKKFGRSAAWFHKVSLGQDESQVITKWEPVSQSSETTFEEDEPNYETVKAVMFEVAKDVHKRILEDNYLFRNVGIKIRFQGFETHTRSCTLPFPSDSLDVILRETGRLLAEFVSSQKSVRLIGVRLASLEKKEKVGAQMSLSAWEGS